MSPPILAFLALFQGPKHSVPLLCCDHLLPLQLAVHVATDKDSVTLLVTGQAVGALQRPQ